MPNKNNELQNVGENAMNNTSLHCVKSILQKLIPVNNDDFFNRNTKKTKQGQAYFMLSNCNYEIFGEKIQCLMEKLKINEFQAVFFCIVFESSIENKKIGNSSISRKLQCNVIDLVFYQIEIERLLELGIIDASYDSFEYMENRHSAIFTNEFTESDYYVPSYVVSKVINDEALDGFQDKYSDEEFLELFAETINDGSFPGYWRKIHMKAKRNKNSFLCSKISELIDVMNPINICALIIISYNKLEGKPTYVDQLASDICPGRTLTRKFIEEFNDGKHPLIKNGYVICYSFDIVKSHSLALTKKGISVFLKNINLKDLNDSDKTSGLITPKDIPEKTLHYNVKDNESINEICDILQEENYCLWRKRLQDKNMSSGITILLHGAPGTGKTETVWQLARKTERAVSVIDASSIKSMWFGGSEKNIKEVFDKYRYLYFKLKRTPIMFFNEADAIFGKRKDVLSSNVAQTENTMQNIILQEIEKFNGILIATTNLTTNLDAAFERRFLFKVQLTPPLPSIAAKIWQQFIPWINENDCTILANSFPFSGAQIENISRKCMIYELRNGINADLNQINEYCSLEKIEQGHPRIGYR